MEEAPGSLGMSFGLSLRGQATGTNGRWLGVPGVFADETLVALLEACVHARKSRSHSSLYADQ